MITDYNILSNFFKVLKSVTYAEPLHSNKNNHREERWKVLSLYRGTPANKRRRNDRIQNCHHAAPLVITDYSKNCQ